MGLQKRISTKSGAGPATGSNESSKPGDDITFITNEKRKPWLEKFLVTDFFVG